MGSKEAACGSVISVVDKKYIMYYYILIDRCEPEVDIRSTGDSHQDISE